MPQIPKVAIIGGGVAGLATSIALARIGMACHIYENGNPKEGASIGFSGRAANALEELGLYKLVSQAGRAFAPDTAEAAMRDSTGKLLGGSPKRPSWSNMKDTVVIYRPTLIEAMTKVAEELRVRIENGITFTNIRNHATGVSVDLTDGSTQDYDCLIGADGVGSATRQAIFPDCPQPEYAGQLSIRWMAPSQHIEGESWYHSPTGRFGFYSLPEGHIYVASIFDMPEDRISSNEEAHDLFAKLLDSCTAPAAVELRQRLTSDARLIARRFRWILVDKPWFHNRVILVGDAAHATTAHIGMGGGMALEDAVVLAQSIEKANGVCEDAFETFMKRRFERVRTVVESSLAISKLSQERAPMTRRILVLERAREALSNPY